MINTSESTPTRLPSTALSVQIDAGPFDPFTLWMRSETACLTASPEAFVAATLLPAMSVGASSVSSPGPLDPLFARNLTTIQDIFTTWYPNLKRVMVAPESLTEPPQPSANKTASCFTGGVDSFYTLLKHENEIDCLLYVHGFDVALDNLPLREQVSDMLQEVGAHFGKEVIEVETNLRDFSNRYSPWERYHGAALATVALSLRPTVTRCFIPSSFPYNHLRLWGSHPLLDPLWGTENFVFYHDGCEASRFAKCKRIGADPVAMRHLRVCWENPKGAYNCGRCEKCIRTNSLLLAAGALQEPESFDASALARTIRQEESIQSTIRRLSYQYRPALPSLRKLPEARALVQAVEASFKGSRAEARLRRLARKLKRRFYSSFATPFGRHLPDEDCEVP
jgi:hypothetical protein